MHATLYLLSLLLQEPFGFDSHKSIYILPVDSTCNGSLGFSQSEFANAFHVTPFIGVRFEPIEELINELLDRQSSAAPTIRGQIGWLMPDKRDHYWNFKSENDILPFTNEIMIAIQDYGLPFIRSRCTLPAVTEILAQQPRLSIKEHRQMSLPVAYYLLGDFEQSRKILDKTVIEYGDATYPLAMTYRRFATRLCERL